SQTAGSSTQRPSVVMPTGTTSYRSRSMTASTSRAVRHETPCSLDWPPKTTAIVVRIGSTLLACETGPMQPDTVTVIAGRPAHEPGAPLNAPITLASSFHAGGAFEYGRHGNPAYESFEDVVGEL